MGNVGSDLVLATPIFELATEHNPGHFKRAPGGHHMDMAILGHRGGGRQELCLEPDG